MDYAQQHGIDRQNHRHDSGASGKDLRRTATSERQAETSQPLTSDLDLFSISQTKVSNRKGKLNDRRIYDECVNKAPYFAYEIAGKKWGVVQGCCNDWNCPRCGHQRAREEYGRIVAGCREIAKTSPLYLLTITCRGKEMSLDDAELHYLEWTNRLLTRIRTTTKRAGGRWAYASVTERQKRAHPHSHFLTTYCPTDAVLVEKGGQKYFETVHAWFQTKHDTLQSAILERACTECGLGYQYDISRLESVEAGSRYVAKYLFKASIFETVWPKKWRRVRYSQNWPKLPEVKTNAMILLSNDDWYVLARRALIVVTQDDGVRRMVERKIGHAGVIVN